MADLSVPAADLSGVCPVTAILDSGSGVTTMSEAVARKLQRKFPEVKVVQSMGVRQYVKAADGRAVKMTEKTCPVRIALHTNWGPVALGPFSFAVSPGTDDVVIVGSPTLAELVINPYDSLNARARERVHGTIQVVEMANFKECHHVSLSVEAMQHRENEQIEPSDEAVESLAAREPEMCMAPEQEELERAAAVNAVVQKATGNGLSEQGMRKLGLVLDRRWNAFRRALRGDPPAEVKPLDV